MHVSKIILDIFLLDHKTLMSFCFYLLFQMQYSPQYILTLTMEQEEDISTSLDLLIPFPNQSEMLFSVYTHLQRCDSTSCFSGKGKVRPLKLMMNNSELISVCARLGTSVYVSDHDLQVLESFVCELYGKPKHQGVNKVRFDRVRQCFEAKKSIL